MRRRRSHRSRGTSSAGASSTRSTRARASSVGVFGRRSIMSARYATTRSRSPASARASPRCRLAATTTFPLTPLLDSTTPTSAHSILCCSGRPSPPPSSRSCARVRRRVYRARISSRSVSLSSASAELGEALAVLVVRELSAGEALREDLPCGVETVAVAPPPPATQEPDHRDDDREPKDRPDRPPGMAVLCKQHQHHPLSPAVAGTG